MTLPPSDDVDRETMRRLQAGENGVMNDRGYLRPLNRRERLVKRFVPNRVAMAGRCLMGKGVAYRTVVATPGDVWIHGGPGKSHAMVECTIFCDRLNPPVAEERP